MSNDNTPAPAPSVHVRAPRGEAGGDPGFAGMPPATPQPPKVNGGLPGGLVSPSTFDQPGTTEGKWFTIPARDKYGTVMDPSWGDRDQADLRFFMITLSPDREEKAAAAAGMNQNFQAVFAEMVMMSVAQIGATRTKGRRDTVKLWMKQLGPRGRKYVEAAYNRMSSVTEADLNAFLDGEESGTI